MIVQSVITFLSNQSEIYSLLGQSPTRIWPSHLPQNPVIPAVVILKTASKRPVKIGGGRAGLASSRLQIDCWGKTYQQASQLAEAVRLKIEGYIGPLDDDNNSDGVILYSDWDHHEPLTDEYRISLDLDMWHAET